MDSAHSSIRKAAVLVASLDDDAAQAVMRRMDPAQAMLVREALDELGPVDGDERQSVIEEFVRRGAPPARSPLPEGEGSGVRACAADSVGQPRHREPAARIPHVTDELALGGPRPFQFLDETECERVAPFLASEHPQTIAVVVRHLSPRRAVAMLGQLPPSLQGEVVRRMIDLEDTEPEILREVERGLETRITEQARHAGRRVAGLATVSRILAADGGNERRILANLAARDAGLARQLARPTIAFGEFESLDAGTLETIFQAAGREVSLLALAGSSEALVERLMSRLPADEARRARRQFEQLGPIRLSDVETAQFQVVEAALRLELEGRIELPRRPRPLEVA